MKILAVSGGIDSVVLLYYFRDDSEKPVVAHFDHGIRSNSHEDADFVRRLAEKYGLPFEMRRLELGVHCSEERAREERYRFLRELAEKYHGTICVAHHADDILESIAINILRGTGWRGLVPMHSGDIERPLLSWHKTDIYKYATEHSLSFRQDSTNTEPNYLRNRVREKYLSFPEESKKQLLELYEKQAKIVDEVDGLLGKIAPKTAQYSRELFSDDSIVSQEILRHILKNHGISLTRPQLQRAVRAIREYSPGKLYSLGRNQFIKIGKYSFSVTGVDLA